MGGIQEKNDSVKKGYLHETFRLFHLRDQVSREYEYHYHDFFKIVVLVSGHVEYHLEGKTYSLKPGDILMVDRFAIHKPEIDASVPYERFVLWIREDLEEQKLLECFREGRRQGFSLLETEADERRLLYSLLRAMEKEGKQDGFGAELMIKSLFTQFMVQLGRMAFSRKEDTAEKDCRSDAVIEDLLQYINGNLTGDLSVDGLAGRCYVSKYYLMRKFKEETGCTLHQYVLSKRLVRGRSLIAEGYPVTKAALLCGFSDYTTFVRAYRKQFGTAPGEARYAGFSGMEAGDI